MRVTGGRDGPGAIGPAVSGPSAAADGVEQALAILRASPGGGSPPEEYERACSVLYRALLARLSALCRKYGLDDQEAADVLHPKFVQFVARDVHRVKPTRRDVEQWMAVVCRNAVFKLLVARKKRLARFVELDAVGEPASESDPAEHAVENEEPLWLDTPFPQHVDRDRFVEALDGLHPDELWLFLKALRHAEEPGPSFRFPASAVARELGKTPGAVSVSWNRVMAKLRSACGAWSNAT